VTTADRAARKRIFIALWPEGQTRRNIATLMKSGALGMVTGKPVPIDNLHITLAFLGDVGLDQVDRLAHMLGRIEQAPYSLTLDRIGCFPRARVVWLGASRRSRSFAKTRRRVNQVLDQTGFRTEKREAVPHVTLFRKARPLRDVPFDPIDWPVSEVCLVESNLSPEGAIYRVIARSGMI
jgi:2'-5' RNA ligase